MAVISPIWHGNCNIINKINKKYPGNTRFHTSPEYHKLEIMFLTSALSNVFFGRKELGEAKLKKIENQINQFNKEFEKIGKSNFKGNKKDFEKRLFTFLEKDYSENFIFKGKRKTVEENMETLQMLINTYGIDHQIDFSSHYPKNLIELYNEAKKFKYWEQLKNPYTLKTGIGINGALMDYENYKKIKKFNCQGLVLYEVIGETKFRIYGCDLKGNLLKKIIEHEEKIYNKSLMEDEDDY
jgi:hypothetical protein